MTPEERRAARRAAEQQTDGPSWPVSLAFYYYCLVILALVLAFTPMTNSLDDVKIWIMNVGGASLLVTFLLLWFFDEVDAPHPWVFWPWIGFLGANVVSTVVPQMPLLGATPELLATREFLLQRARVITGIEVTWFYLSVTGFVFCGVALMRSKVLVERSLKLWLIAVLSTTLFGLFHYGGGFSALRETISARADSRLYLMVVTFAGERTMLSTILNTQFFGNFLSMLFPVSAVAVLVYGRRFLAAHEQHRPGAWVHLAWAIVAGIAALSAAGCAYLTFQKSSLIPMGFSVVALVLGMHFYTDFKLNRIRHLPVVLTGVVATLGVLALLTWSDLEAKLVSMDDSFAPRTIIFGGAIRQFLDFPVFGAGPGSFRILFPIYRDPEYHLNRISNVTQYSHNWVLDLLSEVGLAGTLPYLAFVLGVFWFSRRAIAASNDQHLRLVIVAYMVGFAAILLANMVTPMSRWPVGAGTLHAFAALAMGAACFALNGTAKKPEGAWVLNPEHMTRGVLLGFAVLFFVQTVGRQNGGWTANLIHSESVQELNLAAEQLVSRRGTAEARNEAAQESLQRAVAGFKEAIRIDPVRPTSYYQLAYALNLKGDLDGALDVYRSLQIYSPDYAEIHYNFGVIHMTQAADLISREDRASGAAVEKLLRNAVSDFRLAARMSRKLNTQRRFADALLALSRALPEDSTEGIRLAAEAADVYTAVADMRIGGDADEIEREREARRYALERAPEAFALAGDRIGQARAYERLVREDPADSDALLRAYLAYVAARAEDDAQRVARDAVTLNPLNARFQMIRHDAITEMDERQGRAYARFLLEIDSAAKGFLDEERRSRLQSASREAGPAAPTPTPAAPPAPRAVLQEDRPATGTLETTPTTPMEAGS